MLFRYRTHAGVLLKYWNWVGKYPKCCVFFFEIIIGVNSANLLINTLSCTHFLSKLGLFSFVYLISTLCGCKVLIFVHAVGDQYFTASSIFTNNIFLGTNSPVVFKTTFCLKKYVNTLEKIDLKHDMVYGSWQYHSCYNPIFIKYLKAKKAFNAATIFNPEILAEKNLDEVKSYLNDLLFHTIITGHKLWRTDLLHNVLRNTMKWV